MKTAASCSEACNHAVAPGECHARGVHVARMWCKVLGLWCLVWRLFAHCTEIVKLYCYSTCNKNHLHEVCGMGD